ncbi:hypothetical protein GALMADRAFT_255550 [Galerina marginata CBS 339.88]|uniref:DH domain-containing protein n=1 Tax=Galerina marginata (strain CBS 339.88) TaxID=685588 RepID=A0A067SIB9_GALM3|nr:hypothetical protein GALMADRAFT_255550 [Galerina marginata CBS 339.88]
MSFVAERNANTKDDLLSGTADEYLYQRCLSLRTKLLRIRGLDHYFKLSAISTNSQQPSDPVSQLWDLFSFGAPLCYIFDQLPSERGFRKLNNSSFGQEQYNTNPDRTRKRAIVLFAMQILGPIVKEEIPGCDPFTVTDLWDRSSTNGLLKVINTVEAIIDRFPHCFFEETPSSSDMIVSLQSSIPAENIINIISELIVTERKYVHDLQSTLIVTTALSEANVMDQDGISLLFPELEKLVDFQSKFLTGLESISRLPWQEQRWGRHFFENEDGFATYMAYGFNYTKACTVVPTIEENLGHFQLIVKDLGGLSMQLVRPISRLCKYPLLLDCLIKQCSPSTYAHYSELQFGADAAKRVADKLNDAQRRGNNEHIVDGLRSRVQDWKGHHLNNFGKLLLEDVFMVTKSDTVWEYHVCLFEHIIILCQPEAGHRPAQGRKNPPLSRPRRTQDTLLLKGRIYWHDVTQVFPVPAQIPQIGIPVFPLCIWWKGDDALESFVLRCRTEYQMQQWEAMINSCIKSPRIAQDSETDSIYSLASSRTASTDYGVYYTRWAISQDMTTELGSMQMRQSSDSFWS